jgi:hypothetical protein
MAIGAMVVLTKRVLPERHSHTQSAWFRWAPVASAAVVLVIGVVMTGVSLGWLPKHWLVG